MFFSPNGKKKHILTRQDCTKIRNLIFCAGCVGGPSLLDYRLKIVGEYNEPWGGVEQRKCRFPPDIVISSQQLPGTLWQSTDLIIYLNRVPTHSHKKHMRSSLGGLKVENSQLSRFDLWNKRCWDFPGGPAVKNPCFHWRGYKFNPWSRRTSHDALFSWGGEGLIADPPHKKKEGHILPSESESEVAQSCLTLRPVDCRPPSSSVHGILQARILEWVAISFSRWSSQPRDRTQVSHIAGRCFNLCATREDLKYKNTVFQKTSCRDTELQIQVLTSKVSREERKPGWKKNGEEAGEGGERGFWKGRIKEVKQKACQFGWGITLLVGQWTDFKL